MYNARLLPQQTVYHCKLMSVCQPPSTVPVCLVLARNGGSARVVPSSAHHQLLAVGDHPPVLGGGGGVHLVQQWAHARVHRAAAHSRRQHRAHRRRVGSLAPWLSGNMADIRLRTPTPGLWLGFHGADLSECHRQKDSMPLNYASHCMGQSGARGMLSGGRAAAWEDDGRAAAGPISAAHHI